jgi:hypothetical protein
MRQHTCSHTSTVCQVCEGITENGIHEELNHNLMESFHNNTVGTSAASLTELFMMHTLSSPPGPGAETNK